jgi:chemotaxis signal transduction protein
VWNWLVLPASYARKPNARTISRDMIQPTPDIASQIIKDFGSSIVVIDKRMISLISLDAILSANTQLFAA